MKWRRMDNCTNRWDSYCIRFQSKLRANQGNKLLSSWNVCVSCCGTISTFIFRIPYHIHTKPVPIYIRQWSIYEQTNLAPRRRLPLSWPPQRNRIWSTSSHSQTQFTIQHVLGHQDDNTHESELIIEAKFNIKTDEIVTENVKLPINTHAISSPYEVFVKDRYIHHNIDRYIRSQSYENEARKFLQEKNKWNTTTFQNITWDHHSQIINNLPKTSKRFNLIFINHRLPTGNMQFTPDHRCLHCQHIFDINTPYDHFLQYPQTWIEKKRLDSIELILDRILSPQKLKKAIINHLN